MMNPTSLVDKNNAIGIIYSRNFEEGVKIDLYASKGNQVVGAENVFLKSPDVHFFFCLQDDAIFAFSPQYQRTLASNRSFFIYEPSRDLQLSLSASEECRLVHLQTTIEYLHELFVADAPEMAFLTSAAEKKYYEERPLPASMLAPLQQLFSSRLSVQAQRLFLRGKIYEILALYFHHEENMDAEACPFLQDEDSVKRVKRAKDILLENFTNPPSMAELSRSVGINELKLKNGFKDLYNSTVYGFVLDYKLETARGMLDSKQYKINEIAFSMGYSNPSHFISAFKKKYGITPKQYTKEGVD
jgi:AraC-like DNA-binding protein